MQGMCVCQTKAKGDARYVCVSANPAILYFNTEVHSSLRTIRQKAALSVYSMIATASQYSDLGLPTIRICVFMAGKNWNSVGLLYFSRTSLSLTLIMLMIGWEPLCFSSCSSEQSSSIKLSSSSSSSFFSFGVRVKSREGKVLAREGAKWKSCFLRKMIIFITGTLVEEVKGKTWKFSIDRILLRVSPNLRDSASEEKWLVTRAKLYFS